MLSPLHVALWRPDLTGKSASAIIDAPSFMVADRGANDVAKPNSDDVVLRIGPRCLAACRKIWRGWKRGLGCGRTAGGKGREIERECSRRRKGGQGGRKKFVLRQ